MSDERGRIARSSPRVVRSEPLANGRLHAESCVRNEQPIIDALTPVLDGRSGVVLEIGSGTGQHAVAWAHAFPELTWQPSDPLDAHLDSIRAWAAARPSPNLRAPLVLDATTEWSGALDGTTTAVISVNVIHISPWAVAEGIVSGAAAALSPGGALIFYGPFMEGGQHTGDGNVQFDASLRARDPEWGIRDLGDVAELAGQAGFGPPDVISMPANNRLVVFSRT
jgi:SAM-dependent methyltransferase